MKHLYIETQISILEELIMTINPKTMTFQQLLELSRMSRQLCEWSEHEIQNRHHKVLQIETHLAAQVDG